MMISRFNKNTANCSSSWSPSSSWRVAHPRSLALKQHSTRVNRFMEKVNVLVLFRSGTSSSS